MVVVVASCGVVATVIGKFEFWKMMLGKVPSSLPSQLCPDNNDTGIPSSTFELTSDRCPKFSHKEW
jgi:hypothetical protein